MIANPSRRSESIMTCSRSPVPIKEPLTVSQSRYHQLCDWSDFSSRNTVYVSQAATGRV